MKLPLSFNIKGEQLRPEREGAILEESDRCHGRIRAGLYLFVPIILIKLRAVKTKLDLINFFSILLWTEMTENHYGAILRFVLRRYLIMRFSYYVSIRKGYGGGVD